MKKQDENIQVTEPEVAEQPEAVAAPVRVVCQEEVDKIIRQNVYGAMGLGLVPVHWFQFAAVLPVQLNLARQLSKLYGVPFKEGLAKNIITSVIGAGASTLVSPFVKVAVAGIPLMGLPLAVSAQPLMNMASTYAVGHMFVNHFERGGNFVKANVDEMKKDFTNAYRNSREWLGHVVAGKKSEEAPAEAVAAAE